MCSSIDTFSVIYLNEYQNVKNELIWRWRERENVPNIFRYKLNVQQQKILDGRHGFFVQVRGYHHLINQNNRFFHFSKLISS